MREPILVALHILMQNPDIALDDAKAQARLHGTRITAAGVPAAQRLLQRQDEPTAPEAPTASAATTALPARRTRKRNASFDIDALLRATVSKFQANSAADAERLRAATRSAIATLQAAVA